MPIQVLTAAPPAKRLLNRPVLIVLGSLLLTLSVTFAVVAREAEPQARRRIVETLEMRLHCKVELDEVHLGLLHGLEVSGSGLRIQALDNTAPARPGDPPVLSARTFQFATTLGDLFLHHTSAITAYAQGLEIYIPAANDREHLQQTDPGKPRKPRDSPFLNRLIATDSRLTLATRDPEHHPNTEFRFDKLILDDPGKGLPFVFEAILTNPKPDGEVHATGHIGPWVFGSARDTPVDANFTFEHADLGTIKGLGGTMTAVSRLTGPLGAMNVAGTINVPDFALDISAHPFAVRAEYRARVDGTTGNVALDSVSARFLGTAVEGNGLIASLPNPDHDPKHGVVHDTNLDIHIVDGRAEDLLVLFSHAPRPMLSGKIDLAGHLEVPPGKERMILRLKVNGKAAIAGALWSSPPLQEKVDTLSQRAENHSRQALKNPAANPVVPSSLAGTFTILDANIDIRGLTYRLPGAVLQMEGRYPLIDRELSFHGVARTEATAAQMETGWKSLLLRPISPFLHKNGAGMQIPVSFTGDKSSPRFALDLQDGKADAAVAAPRPLLPRSGAALPRP